MIGSYRRVRGGSEFAVLWQQVAVWGLAFGVWTGLYFGLGLGFGVLAWLGLGLVGLEFGFWTCALGRFGLGFGLGLGLVWVCGLNLGSGWCGLDLGLDGLGL